MQAAILLAQAPSEPGIRFSEALRETFVGPFTPMANARIRSTDGTTVTLPILKKAE